MVVTNASRGAFDKSPKAMELLKEAIVVWWENSLVYNVGEDTGQGLFPCPKRR